MYRGTDMFSRAIFGIAAALLFGVVSGCSLFEPLVGKTPVVAGGGPYEITVFKELLLRGSVINEDGNIKKFEWDFDGDGVYDWSSTNTGYVNHSYRVEGEYLAQLRVTGENGQQCFAAAKVTVNDRIPITLADHA